jgi:hemolysin activation/secretion protein
MPLNIITRSRMLHLLLRYLLGTTLTVVGFSALAQQTPTTAVKADNSRQPASFDLFELRVKGNTVLDKQSIERTVYPFLGKQKSLDIVEQARLALENLYHNKGYQTIAVDIPEQDVVNGVVYLQIAEGKVSRLRVTDSRYFSLGAIKSKVPELAEGNVPNMPVMQAQLTALAKESPDRTVTPVLRAGETPGTLEVDLKVNDELPLHGKFELNGRNTATTDRLRAIASLHYDNLWQKNHSASLMYQTSPENFNQVEVVVGSYVMPFLDSDKRLAFFAVNSSSNSVSNAGTLSVVGSGSIYGLRFVDPITTPIKNLYQTFTAGVSYKDFKQNLSGPTIGTLFQKTPISYLPFLLGYSGTLKLDESQIGLNINANFAFRNVGSNEAEFDNSRYLAKSDYAYLNGGLSYNHNLPYGMEFVSRLNGQIADSPLIPNEQFSIGGMQSVRGYYETSVLADDGLQTSLELYTPRVNVQDWPEYNKVRGLVFMDAGKGWIKDALSGSPSQYELASAGTGFRMNLWKTLTANFDVAVPFVSQIQSRVEKGNPRLHFQIFTEF